MNHISQTEDTSEKEIVFSQNCEILSNLEVSRPVNDHTYASNQDGFRFAVLFLIVFVTVSVVAGYAFLFPEAQEAISYLEHAWAMGHYLWLAGVPATLLGFLGLFMYRRRPLEWVFPVDRPVVFRVVSFGRNVSALTGSINNIVARMDEAPLFKYTIEIVVEEGQPFAGHWSRYPDDFIKFIVVPQDYQTPKNTVKKARALQYALENSDATDDTWIVHLDEESRPTKSMILGIAEAIYQEESSGQYRIGQGVITYYRHWVQGRFFWWTLLDSARTGQDLGPFYLQNKLGTSLYGFHGSWILIRNSVAKSIPGQFDLGPAGSITEDAWWCLVANSAGHRIRWVEGYLEEQSVRSFSDFLKQRGRWFYGLRLVGRHTPVHWLRRLPIKLNLTLWMLVWASIPYSIVHLWFGLSVSPIMLALVAGSLATYTIMVVAGMWVNLHLAGMGQWWRYLLLTPLQIALVPIYAIMEMYAAFVHGVCFPDRNGFHVIQK